MVVTLLCGSVRGPMQGLIDFKLIYVFIEKYNEC